MLTAADRNHIQASYRDAKDPKAQKEILHELYPGENIEEIIAEIVPAVSVAEKAKNRKWSDRDDRVLLAMRDEGRTAAEIAKVLCRTTQAVYNRLNTVGAAHPPKPEAPPVQESAVPTIADPSALNDLLHEAEAQVLTDLQTEAVYYLATDRFCAEVQEGDTGLELRYCLRAAQGYIDTLIAQYTDAIKRHPAAEDSFAEVIALLTMDELKSRGGAATC